MSILQHITIAVVGDASVGKTSLLQNYISKYFRTVYCEGEIDGDGNSATHGMYICNINTNRGVYDVRFFETSDKTDTRLNNISCAIIMSDVTDINMARSYNDWYDAIKQQTIDGETFIVHCFNKIDILSQPTYIFDTALPSFDISVKTTSGISELLTFILQVSTKINMILICL